MFEVSLDGVTRKIDYKIIKNELLCKMNSNEKELEDCKNILLTRNDFVNDFRGKQQLDFLVKQVENLKQDNNKLQKLSVKRNNIKINITNNRLSELSMHAITPNCLINFIVKHRLKK